MKMFKISLVSQPWADWPEYETIYMKGSNDKDVEERLYWLLRSGWEIDDVEEVDEVGS